MTNKAENKKILDVACGGRRFWFNKTHPDTLYVDIREPQTVSWGKIHSRSLDIKPDMVMDFRSLDLPDNSFNLVVFDPPHLLKSPDTSFLVKTYGKLHPEDWQDDLSKGFKECFRILKPDGVLIFKWSSVQIPLAEILKLTPIQPLFGHPTGRKHSNTHWVTFMKGTS